MPDIKITRQIDWLKCPFTEAKKSWYTPSNAQLVFLFLVGLFVCFPGINLYNHPEIGTYYIATRMSLYDVLDAIVHIPIPTWFDILNVTFGAGVREEFIYRFLIMKVMCTELLNLSVPLSIGISALLFAIVHLENITHIGNKEEVKVELSYQFMYTFVFGIVYGYLYWYTNDLIFVMVLHGLFDVVSVVKGIIGRYHESKTAEKST